MPEFAKHVELRKISVRGGDSASHARAQAVLHGIRMCGLSGNTWPARDDGLSQLIAEQIISELVSFAIYSRRYMELTGNKKLRTDGPILRIQTVEYRYESDIWTAVNRILHAASIDIHFVTPITTKHDNLGDLLIANAMITSPQRDTVAICPQGLFYGFGQSPQIGPANY